MKTSVSHHIVRLVEDDHGPLQVQVLGSAALHNKRRSLRRTLILPAGGT